MATKMELQLAADIATAKIVLMLTADDLFIYEGIFCQDH